MEIKLVKINSVDLKINKMLASPQNTDGSENLSSELGDEFAELIGQFFSGANLNDNSSEILTQVETSTIVREQQKEKAKPEKKIENNSPEKKADSEETTDQEEVINKESVDSSNEESILKLKTDSSQEEVRAVNVAAPVKSEETKVKDVSLEELIVKNETVDNSQQKQDNDKKTFSEEEVDVNQNNFIQNSKSQKAATTQANNTVTERAQSTSDMTIEQQAVKEVAVKSSKKTPAQQDHEAQENNIADLNNQDLEASLLTASIKQNSLTAVSAKDSTQNISAQLLRAANVVELSVQKNLIKTSSSQSNLDLAGVGANQGFDKGNLAKVKQTLNSLLPRYSEKTLEKVKELLAKATQNRDGNSLTLKLNPRELGEITVKVTQRDNNIYARITPDSPEIESMLRHKAAELTQVLIQAGIKADQLHISIGQERTEAESFKFSEFLSGQQNSRQNELFSDKSKQEVTENPAVKKAFNNQAKNSNIDLGWIA